MNINEYIDDYKKRNDVILIDVRTKEEYMESRIDGSINIPLNEIMTIESIYPDKDKIYYVHCRSGYRSGQATKYMKSIGYKNAINIGGVIDYTGDLIK